MLFFSKHSWMKLSFVLKFFLCCYSLVSTDCVNLPGGEWSLCPYNYRIIWRPLIKVMIVFQAVAIVFIASILSQHFFWKYFVSEKVLSSLVICRVFVAKLLWRSCRIVRTACKCQSLANISEKLGPRGVTWRPQRLMPPMPRTTYVRSMLANDLFSLSL